MLFTFGEGGPTMAQGYVMNRFLLNVFGQNQPWIDGAFRNVSKINQPLGQIVWTANSILAIVMLLKTFL